MLKLNAFELMNTKFAETSGNEFPLGGVDRGPTSRAGSKTILLVSRDKGFQQIFRSFANSIGFIVISAAQKAGAVAVLRATSPVAVLLDLDLPDQAAWDMAEILLNEVSCPPVILLTGRTTQFDMRTAIRAGPLVSKDESPSRLWGIVDEVLETPPLNRAERNAIQRVLIGWLRPSQWAGPTSPAHRFWGINE